MSDRSAFHYGEVRRFLLEAIAEQPRHGYELIRVITERADPDHRLRPGTVYPRLAKLANDGFIAGTSTGRRVVYAITKRGREEVVGVSTGLGSALRHVRARDGIAFGELRQLLLDAIAGRPRHGYELIRVIGERAGSEYRPRPGSVYPRLAKRADDGLIAGTRTGRRVVYAITERGRGQVTAPAVATAQGSGDRATVVGRDDDVLEVELARAREAIARLLAGE